MKNREAFESGSEMPDGSELSDVLVILLSNPKVVSAVSAVCFWTFFLSGQRYFPSVPPLLKTELY